MFQKMKKKISINMNKETLIKGSVKMTTVHESTFQTLKYACFNHFITPIEESLRFHRKFEEYSLVHYQV